MASNGVLFIVSTPIGNLEDITLRAIRILNESSLIAAEDTRHTKKLLMHYKITTPTISYFEHNRFTRIPQILKHLNSGKNVAVVTDAGTPGISDPGYRVVQAAHLNKINVIGIPGPSSVISALSIAGLPTDHFYFEGFLPRKKGRLTTMKFLATLDATIVIFESPLRLIKTLKDVQQHFGNRVISVCREMTKIHEEVFRGSVWKTLNYFQDKPSIKGEIVILIAKDGYQ